MNLIQRSIVDTIDDTYRARLGIPKEDPVLLQELNGIGETRVTPKTGVVVSSCKFRDMPAYRISVYMYNGKKKTVCECVVGENPHAQIRDIIEHLFEKDPEGQLHKIFMLRVNVTEDLLENRNRAMAGIQLRYEPVFHTRIPECMVEFASEEFIPALMHADAIAYYSCDGEFFFAPTCPTCGIDKGMWTDYDIRHLIGIDDM